VIYEIPPGDRHRLARFQHALGQSTVACLGADADAWRAATDKQRMVGLFEAASVPQMESVVLHGPSASDAETVLERLGGDVWARPAVGMGGRDVFHITNCEQLRAVVARYAASGEKFLLSRDAGNVDGRGRRHQYRVVVLGDRVLRVCEHVHTDPDLPCNESRGARSTVIAPDALAPSLAELAITATRALGLSFGGVDLVAENGGVVFEVNVHPVLTGDQSFDRVAIPFVRAHLTDSVAAIGL